MTLQSISHAGRCGEHIHWRIVLHPCSNNQHPWEDCTHQWHHFIIFFKILFIYFYREGNRGRKTGRETSMCGCLSHAGYWGPGLQPRHVPWLGIEPVTLWFSGQHSVHWATPARANDTILYCLFFLKIVLLQLSQFFSPLHSPLPCAFQHSLPLVHVHELYIWVLWLVYILYYS